MPIGGLLTVGAAGAQAGLGIAKTISGAVNLRKDKKEMANLATPFYKVQNEYLQNQKLAEVNAGSGTPDATKNFETTELQRGLGSGLGTVTQTGGDPNAIAKILSGYDTGVARIGAEDAQAHLQNINQFMERNKEVAGQKTMQWSINEYDPYKNKLKELKDRMAADKQNTWGGISDTISAVGAAGVAMQNAKDGGGNPTNTPLPQSVKIPAPPSWVTGETEAALPPM